MPFSLLTLRRTHTETKSPNWMFWITEIWNIIVSSSWWWLLDSISSRMWQAWGQAQQEEKGNVWEKVAVTHTSTQPQITADTERTEKETVRLFMRSAWACRKNKPSLKVVFVQRNKILSVRRKRTATGVDIMSGEQIWCRWTRQLTYHPSSNCYVRSYPTWQNLSCQLPLILAPLSSI